MIGPTVGRIVWYWPSKGDHPEPSTGPLAAIVTHVYNSRRVNLRVFDSEGEAHALTDILLLQPEDDRPDESRWCEWMPYQKGQAAKTEALEADVARRTAPPSDEPDRKPQADPVPPATP